MKGHNVGVNWYDWNNAPATNHNCNRSSYRSVGK